MTALNIVRSIRRDYDIPVLAVLLAGGPLEETFREAASWTFCYPARLAAGATDRREVDAELLQTLNLLGIRHALCNTTLSGEISHRLAGEGVRVLALVHELPVSIRSSGWQRQLHYHLASAADVVFPSQTVQKAIDAEFGAAGGRAHILPQPGNLGSTERVHSERLGRRTAMRRALRLSGEDFLVLGCGFGDLRKGVDLFVATARILAGQEDSKLGEKRLVFGWLGQIDPYTLGWLRRDAEDLSTTAVELRFLGESDDPLDFFLAADLFYLSSREDPFPNAVSEAQLSALPVIAFQDSGGVVDQLGDNTGILVPYGDVRAAAAAIRALAEDGEKHAAMAKAARQRGAANPGRREYATALLQILQFGQTLSERTAGSNRSVTTHISAAVPAYQAARHIEERMWSIFEQELLPGEIYCIDDCSRDGTYLMLRRLSAFCPVPFRLKLNSTNSGSPFRQWQRCIEETSADYIWIAESDDFAERQFLSTLAGALERSDNTVLAYAASVPIDVESRILENGLHGYLSQFGCGDKWDRDYVNSGRTEIEECLFLGNTLPNISACVVKRSAAGKAIAAAQAYETAGDWAFHAALLLEGDIAFSARRLNQHRRHGNSVVTQSEGSFLHLLEIAATHYAIASQTQLETSHLQRMIEFEEAELARLRSEETRQQDLLAQRTLQKRLRSAFERRADPELVRNVLVIMPDLQIGGGQLAAIRIASALADRHPVWLATVERQPSDPALLGQLPDNVPLLPEMSLDALTRFCRLAGIQLIISHVWWSDKLAQLLTARLEEVQWLLCMHGCYEHLATNPKIDPQFERLAPAMLGRADCVTYLADKNIAWLQDLDSAPNPGRMLKVYNGLTGKERKAAASQQNPEGAARRFVMAARGIAEKGWNEAAQAAILADRELRQRGLPGITISFFTDSLYIRDLEKSLGRARSVVEFRGKVNRLLDELPAFDVGVLPSSFVSESQPYFVIECLSAGLPVLVTDIGECAAMLETPQHTQAGALIPANDDGKADVEALTKLFVRCATEQEFIESLRERTAAAAGKFDLVATLSAIEEMLGPSAGRSPLRSPIHHRPVPRHRREKRKAQ